mmetsp:Transcript_24204/g.78893  ORF Transcript_24204/g.78893 Transcript_24204/m.78893 type:complete len:293 (+) Transcript_24204:1690-2568(+)
MRTPLQQRLSLRSATRSLCRDSTREPSSRRRQKYSTERASHQLCLHVSLRLGSRIWRASWHRLRRTSLSKLACGRRRLQASVARRRRSCFRRAALSHPRLRSRRSGRGSLRRRGYLSRKRHPFRTSSPTTAVLAVAGASQIGRQPSIRSRRCWVRLLSRSGRAAQGRPQMWRRRQSSPRLISNAMRLAPVKMPFFSRRHRWICLGLTRQPPSRTVAPRLQRWWPHRRSHQSLDNNRHRRSRRTQAPLQSPPPPPLHLLRSLQPHRRRCRRGRAPPPLRVQSQSCHSRPIFHR